MTQANGDLAAAGRILIQRAVYGETKKSTPTAPRNNNNNNNHHHAAADSSIRTDSSRAAPRAPMARLKFSTTPAVVQSQQSEYVAQQSLRSASAPCSKLEWLWVHVINAVAEDEDANSSMPSSSSTTITCVQPLNNNRVLLVDSTKLPSLFVQPELIPKVYRDQTICSNVRGHLDKHWLMIYSFVGFSFADRLELRCMCRLFDEVEKIVTLNKHCYQMLPIPTYTYFPHRNYSTLNELMDKLNAEYAALPSGWVKCTAPGALVVGMEVRVEYVDTFKDATIQKVNEDETFDIVYDNDDYGTRKNVPLHEIQIQNVSVIVVGSKHCCFAHNSSHLLFSFI